MTIVLNTDAHGVETLDNMAYGVATARRAWLTAARVANTRGWARVQEAAQALGRGLGSGDRPCGAKVAGYPSAAPLRGAIRSAKTTRTVAVTVEVPGLTGGTRARLWSPWRGCFDRGRAHFRAFFDASALGRGSRRPRVARAVALALAWSKAASRVLL